MVAVKAQAIPATARAQLKVAQKQRAKPKLNQRVKVQRIAKANLAHPRRTPQRPLRVNEFLALIKKHEHSTLLDNYLDTSGVFLIGNLSTGE
jgi:hypothetical protein